MARTSFNAPAHRISPRVFPGANQGAPNQAPSIDFGGSGIQDSRLPYNMANSVTGGQIIGWYTEAPLIDAVPSTLTTTALAAAQVPVVGTPLVLVSVSGAGVTVSSAAMTILPAMTVAPLGTRFLDGAPGYIRFGLTDYTVFYDPTTTLTRNIQIASVGNDSGATFTVSGLDFYGYPLHEAITGANAGTATGKKAFKAVLSITPTGTLSGSNVSVGQGDTFGMPIIFQRSSMISGLFNNAVINGTGTFTAGVTTTATATTGDVRGTWLAASASNNTKRLTVSMSPDPSLQMTLGYPAGLTGVAQF